MIDPDGTYETIQLGLDPERSEVPQYVVPAGKIFGATVNDSMAFSLGSCIVSPGFTFEDFKLYSRDQLLVLFPQHREIIFKLTL